jgi:hypothetical protein
MRALLLAALVLAAGCPQAPCSDGTIYVDLTLDGAAAQASSLRVTVAIAGGRTLSGGRVHQPGDATGVLEIDFPSGYPAGQRVIVIVDALGEGVTLASNSQSLTLNGSCGSVSLTLDPLDGGSSDLAPRDFAAGTDSAPADFAPAPDLVIQPPDFSTPPPDMASPWVAVGPPGGDIFAIAADPNDAQTLRAGTGGGIYLTSDGAATWTSAGPPAAWSCANVLVDTGHELYASCGNQFYKSTDRGASWATRMSGLAQSPITAIAVDTSTAPVTIYAAMQGAGVYKSIDAAANWSASSGGLGDLHVNALAIDPTAPAIVYAGTDSGVFRSTNGGGAWSAASTGLGTTSVHALAISPSASTTLYAGTSGGGVFTSANSGGAWSAVNGSLPNLSVNTLLFAAGTLYAGHGGGTSALAPGASSWTTFNNGNDGALFHQLVYVSGTLYGATDRGVYKSTDLVTWARVVNGLDVWRFGSLAMQPGSSQNLYVYSATQLPSFARSSNGGATWTFGGNGLGDYVRVFSVDTATPGTLYAGVDTVGLMRSTDYGANWTRIATSQIASSVGVIAVAPSSSMVIYASDGLQNVWMSVDGGATWTVAVNGLGGYVQLLVVDPVLPSTVYASTSTGVYVSTSSGANWTAMAGVPSAGLSVIAIDPTNHTTLYGAGDNTPFYTSVAGGAWTPVNSKTFSPSLYQLVAAPGKLLAATGYGLVVSTDGGQTWTNVSYSLPINAVFGVAYDAPSGTAWLLSWANGVYRAPL